MPNINFPAIADVVLVNYKTPEQRELVKDTVILTKYQDLLNIQEAIQEEREHATGQSIITMNNGVIDVGNIRNINYSSVRQKKTNKRGRYLIVVKENATRGSLFVAPFYKNLDDRDRMLAKKGQLVIGAYQANSLEEALKEAAAEANTGTEVLEGYKLS